MIYIIKRPILVVVIGYLIGIIMGLYCKKSIVFFYVLIIAIKVLYKITKRKNKKFDFLNPKRYLRYFKLLIDKKVIIIIILSSVISNTIVIFMNYKYDILYNGLDEVEGEAIVIESKIEKEYSNTYKVKVITINKNIKYKNTYLYLNVNKKISINCKYGSILKFKGNFIKPDVQRNQGGFNYKEHLKKFKIYGNINVSCLEVKKHTYWNFIFWLSNNLNLKIKNKLDLLFDKEISEIIKGILLGDKNNIDEDIQNNFRISGMSHILAVSGMHVVYIIMVINLLFQKVIGKRKTKVLNIIFVLFYMFLTGFSPSVVRASIMAILVLCSELLFRKSDIITSISLSLLITLIYNPFLIQNIGLQLSYLATLGIIILQKYIKDLFKNIKIMSKKHRFKTIEKNSKIISKIQEILSVTISVHIFILPIMIYHFNMVGTYFLISNLIISVILFPIFILCIVIVFTSFFSYQISKIISYILKFLIKTLISVSNISMIPFSKLYFSTPSIFCILFYYFILAIIIIIYNIYKAKKESMTVLRFRNIIALLKYKSSKSKKKIFLCSFIIISFVLLLRMLPNNLYINFIDVGQGDSTLIVTPCKKTILIDGGGTESSKFDVGEKTLLPYILDKGYTKIDYIFISHFDEDHYQGCAKIMEELKVKKVFIAKQGELSNNYEEFKKILKEKNIKVQVVGKGNRINIEKSLYFDIIWPDDNKLINDNILNNNSIVCKLNYKIFSMLFTGDIEEIAERQILEDYNERLKFLNSTILKVGHHGSKTSTTEEFLKAVSPKIALIGVGKNNTFGHPNEQVIERLKENNTRIYRTDTDGEIKIVVNRNGKIVNIQKIIKCYNSRSILD